MQPRAWGGRAGQRVAPPSACQGRSCGLTGRGGGKPRLPGCAAIAFSLAHGDGAAPIGIARGSAIGVDLERRRPVRIAKECRARLLWAGAGLLAAEEVAAPAEAAVLRAWVRLEAVAKADGSGLARTLAVFGVQHTQPPGGRSEVAARVKSHLARTRLKVHDLAPIEASVAAVALDRAVRAPRLCVFPVDRAGIAALVRERRSSRSRREAQGS